MGSESRLLVSALPTQGTAIMASSQYVPRITSLHQPSNSPVAGRARTRVGNPHHSLRAVGYHMHSKNEGKYWGAERTTPVTTACSESHL